MKCHNWDMHILIKNLVGPLFEIFDNIRVETICYEAKKNLPKFSNKNFLPKQPKRENGKNPIRFNNLCG